MLGFSLNTFVMIHALSIYKFTFPFIEYKYEQAICRESISDFEKMLKYKGIYLKTTKENNGAYVNTIVHFIGGEGMFSFNTQEVYYIPKYQCEIYLDSESSFSLMKNIIKIFNSLGLRNYIFDYPNEGEIHMRNKNIITPKTLEENFKLFDEKEIKKFLDTTHTKYLSETLKANVQISNSFLFMIYNCYNFYQNYTNSQKQLLEMGLLQNKNISAEYKGLLELSSRRLEHINNINISTFKKYSYILDDFFDLLKIREVKHEKQ